MKYFYLLLLYLLANQKILAQTYSITGNITDTLKNQLQHVNVILIGTNLGDASDLLGRYRINNIIPGIYVIEYSAIGYETYRMDSLYIRDRSITLNVVLKEKIIVSEEVIVTTGKYEQKKKGMLPLIGMLKINVIVVRTIITATNPRIINGMSLPIII